MKKLLLKTGFVPAILWALLVLVLSTVGGISLPDVSLFEPDKLAHAIVYGVLTYLLIIGFLNRAKFSIKIAFFAFFISSFYGFLLEIVQFAFFPSRYFEIYDIFANIAGSLIVMLFLIFYKK